MHWNPDGSVTMPTHTTTKFGPIGEVPIRHVANREVPIRHAANREVPAWNVLRAISGPKRAAQGLG